MKNSRLIYHYFKFNLNLYINFFSAPQNFYQYIYVPLYHLLYYKHRHQRMMVTPITHNVMCRYGETPSFI